MRRRYYCDYCEKTFIDELEARRKHLKSSFHLRMRNLHFEMYRDSKVILREETPKSPCRRFFSHGECQFSGNCKYTHYTPDELWAIKLQVDQEEVNKQVRIPTVESWLQKYYGKNTKQDSNNAVVSWTYPAQLEQRFDLPPSIKKMRPEQFHEESFEQWG